MFVVVHHSTPFLILPDTVTGKFLCLCDLTESHLFSNDVSCFDRNLSCLSNSSKAFLEPVRMEVGEKAKFGEIIFIQIMAKVRIRFYPIFRAITKKNPATARTVSGVGFTIQCPNEGASILMLAKAKSLSNDKLNGNFAR